MEYFFMERSLKSQWDDETNHYRTGYVEQDLCNGCFIITVSVLGPVQESHSAIA